MAEQKQDAVRVDWRQSVSWLSLFRGFRIALDVKKMLLGFVALVATYGVFLILVSLWNTVGLDAPKETVLPDVAKGVVGLPGALLCGDVETGSDHARRVWSLVRNTTRDFPGFSIVFGVVVLLIWSYFGGAISRMAAVQFGRDERISFTEALTFTGRKYLSLVFAPVIPLLAILFVCVFTGVVGLLAWLPYFGEWFAGLLWPLPLVVGFILSLIAVGGVFGLPLMHPTIGAEGSDAFDAISRSFSYVYSRPWRAAFYAVLATVYGVIVFTFVSLFAGLLLSFSRFCVAFWAGGLYPGGLGEKISSMWPQISVMNWQTWVATQDGYHALSGSMKGASFFLGFWVWLVLGLVWGFAVSYGYSALTIIYFLLRKNVDNTEFDEVYLEEEEEEAFEEFAEETPPSDEGGAGEAEAPEEETGGEPPEESAAPEEEAGGETGEPDAGAPDEAGSDEGASEDTGGGDQ